MNYKDGALTNNKISINNRAESSVVRKLRTNQPFRIERNAFISTDKQLE